MKKFVSLALAGSLLVSLVGCGASSSAAPASSAASGASSAASTSAEISLGVTAPLTGSLATYGESVQKGVNLAIDEINKAGGILDKQVKVTFEDDKGDSTEGANSFNKLVSEGVCAIIGSVTSGVTSGLATLTDENGMLLITPSGTADTLTEGHPSVFRACFNDSYQGSIAAEFAAKDLGAKKVAILYASSDPYSAGIAASFEAACKTYGLDVVAKESSSSMTDTDYSAQLTNIVAAGPDVIFAPYYYDTVGPYIVPQTRAAGYAGVILGADGWDGTTDTMVDDKSLYNNTYFINHYAADNPSEEVQNFVTSFTAAYGSTPNAIAAMSYDAVYMIKTAIEKAGTDTTADIVKAMTGMEFSGVTGSFKLNELNTPEKPAVVMEYVDGKLVFKASVGGAS